MCGRIIQIRPPDELAHAYGVPAFMVKVPYEFRPRYNLAPSQPVLAVRLATDGQRELVSLTWGLVPHWSKEPKTKYSTINARAETVTEKPLYAEAFRHRRCLVPVDGFYEWHEQPGGKQPYRILARDDRPLALAGLYEHWQGEGHAPFDSCTIMVKAANRFMSAIHDRMPVMLTPEAQAVWLDPKSDVETLRAIMGAWPDGLLRAYPVSPAVNSPNNDSAEILQPAS
jgi:putative SOS response-associated peptidase YedK